MENRDDVLGELIADFLQASESGLSVDREAVVAQHPALAGELKEFFANHDAMRQASLAIDDDEDKVGSLLAAAGNAYPAPTFSGGGPPSTATNCRADEQFGDYCLLEEIARGGMGIVYKAQQKRLNRIVALKMILSGAMANASDISRFYAEAEAAARLQHAGIVPIHEVGEQAGVHYYTMSYIEGQSLAEILCDGPLDPMTAAQLLRKVALAVAYAHRHQVIHRDIKPANILIDAHGEPLVTDFGLAKRLDCGQQLTASGQILGTLQYMPPEQAKGRHEALTPGVDIYALGAVLYAMLTGRPPFQAESHFDLLLQVMESEPIRPRKLNGRVPRELERICLKCLEKEPRHRYASAEALAQDLDLFLRGEPLQLATTSVMYAARRLPRRSPALCAHLAGLLFVELFRQGAELAQGMPNIREHWQYHFQFSGILALWAASCFPFQHLLTRPRWADLAKFLWAGADVIFLTWALALAAGPLGPLLTSFALLIVASISFFRVRLVAFMTIACLVAFTMLLVLRPNEAQPIHYSVMSGAVLAVIGVIVGYHVRRMRLLSDYYDRSPA